jgi:hypothetical protein
LEGDWLTQGVDRASSNARSGREFAPSFQMFCSREVQVGSYFETLASPRRWSMVADGSALLRQRVDALRLAALSSLNPSPRSLSMPGTLITRNPRRVIR